MTGMFLMTHGALPQERRGALERPLAPIREIEALELLVELELTQGQREALSGVAGDLARSYEALGTRVGQELEPLLADMAAGSPISPELSERAEQARVKAREAQSEWSREAVQRVDGFLDTLLPAQRSRLLQQVAILGAAERSGRDRPGAGRAFKRPPGSDRKYEDGVQEQRRKDTLARIGIQRLRSLRQAPPEQAEGLMRQLVERRREELAEQGVAPDAVERDTAELDELLLRARTLSEAEFEEQRHQLGAELGPKLAPIGSRGAGKQGPQSDALAQALRQKLAHWLTEPTTGAAVRRLAAGSLTPAATPSR